MQCTTTCWFCSHKWRNRKTLPKAEPVHCRPDDGCLPGRARHDNRGCRTKGNCREFRQGQYSQSQINSGKLTMKTSLLALALAAILAGCGSMQSSTSSSGYGADAPTCQQFRGNMGRGDD